MKQIQRELPSDYEAELAVSAFVGQADRQSAGAISKPQSAQARPDEVLQPLKRMLFRCVRAIDQRVVGRIEDFLDLPRDSKRTGAFCRYVERDGCLNYVLEAHLPQQPDKVLSGLGRLFANKWDWQEREWTRANHELHRVLTKQINSLLDTIERHYLAATHLERGEAVVSQAAIGKFCERVLGRGLATSLGLKIRGNRLGEYALGAYSDRAFSDDLPLTESSVTGQQLEEALRLAEEAAAKAASAETEALRREARLLEELAGIRGKLVDLTEQNQRLQKENRRLILDSKAVAKPARTALEAPVVAPELYPVRAGIDPIGFLKQHYGAYLEYFGAPETVLYQYQLRKLDPKLLLAVQNRLRQEKRRLGTGPTLRDILPTKADRNSRELLSALDAEVRANPRLMSAARRRVRKAHEQP